MTALPARLPLFAGVDERRPLRIADGTLEALKWLALVLMVGDHVNKWLFDARLPGVYQAGRLVAPLFAFVLAYHLARPGAWDGGAFVRVMRRLAIWGAVASVPFVALNGGAWWPLNILLTLLAGVFVVWALRHRTPAWAAAAAVGFVVGGALGEFSWPALLMFGAAWIFCAAPSAASLLAWVLSVALQQPVNGNAWALGAVAVVALAAPLDLRVPRIRHLFYVVYPLHLALIWLAATGRSPA